MAVDRRRERTQAAVWDREKHHVFMMTIRRRDFSAVAEVVGPDIGSGIGVAHGRPYGAKHIPHCLMRITGNNGTTWLLVRRSRRPRWEGRLRIGHGPVSFD